MYVFGRDHQTRRVVPSQPNHSRTCSARRPARRKGKAGIVRITKRVAGHSVGASRAMRVKFFTPTGAIRSPFVQVRDTGTSSHSIPKRKRSKTRTRPGRLWVRHRSRSRAHRTYWNIRLLSVCILSPDSFRSHNQDRDRHRIRSSQSLPELIPPPHDSG